MTSNHRILVVDDDPINTLILEDILSGKHQYKIVNSGEKALEQVPIFRPDIILLDIMMPGISGYDVCRLLRAEKKFHFIKIILISSKSSLKERLKGYEVGANDYVVKPYDVAELEAKINVYLRLKNAEEVDEIKSVVLKLFSHETRTPLNGIINLAAILKAEAKLNQENLELVEIIEQSAIKLYEAVKKSEFLCELKEGFELNKQTESLIAHMNKILSTAQSAAKEKNVQLKITHQGELEINADWALLDTAFGYIIDNAIKYSPVNDAVHIEINSQDEWVVVTVTDHGEGIKSDWLDKIFEEFSIQNIAHHHQGVVISLAITKKILEYHQGNVSAENLPEGGAKFTITLKAD